MKQRISSRHHERTSKKTLLGEKPAKGVLDNAGVQASQALPKWMQHTQPTIKLIAASVG
jgi:DNA-directed RNA polymerase subunit H (RpoH/RPB5)